MKRFILYIVSLFMIASANSQGNQNNFFINVEDKNIRLENVENFIFDHFKIEKGNAFHLKKYNERVDKLGMTHTTFVTLFNQEYNILEESIIVHSYAGKVLSINGNLSSLFAKSNKSDFYQAKMLHSDKKRLALPVIRNNEKELRPVIEHIDTKRDRKVYIDAITGDTLKIRNTKIFNKVGTLSDTTAWVQTMYYGEQLVDCTNQYFDALAHSSQYSLMDRKRNIICYNYRLDIENELMTSYSKVFGLEPYLSEIKLSYFGTFGGWGYTGLEDSTYFTISDHNGSILFKSDTLIGERITYSFEDDTLWIKDGLTLTIHSKFNLAVWNDSTESFEVGEAIWDTAERYYPPVRIPEKSGDVVTIDMELDEYYKIKTVVKENPIYDIYWGIQQTYDYYFNRFGRYGFDNKNGETICLYGADLTDNAYFSEGFDSFSTISYFHFGKGSDESTPDSLPLYSPFTTLDVVAHEFTHGVTSHNGNGGLDYYGESGALNESFSDIFATAIEIYTGYGNPQFIGDEMSINTPFMRNMGIETDTFSKQPKYYMGEYWYNTHEWEDNAGVHTNSGVQNAWFYLLFNGGSGVNEGGYHYNVEGIGIEKAEEIAYRNLSYYIHYTSSYKDAVWGSLQAAADLYGKNSIEFKSVKEAWCAVGLCLDDVINVVYDPKLHKLNNQNHTLSHVYTENNHLIVLCQKGSLITILTPEGQTIASRKASSNCERFEIVNKPFVLVTINNETHKILLQ